MLFSAVGRNPDEMGRLGFTHLEVLRVKMSHLHCFCVHAEKVLKAK